MFKVHAKYLLIIAGAVWIAAGVNIVRLGVLACLEGTTPLWVLVVGIALALAGIGFLVHFVKRGGVITCPVTKKTRVA